MADNSDRSVDDIVQFTSIVKNHESYLCRIVCLEFGLLDKLVRCGVLTNEQVEQILEERTDRDRILALVKELSTDSQHLARNKELFLEALAQAKNKHVSNFIRGDGKRAAEFGDEWPLLNCEPEIHILRNYRDTFTDLVDPSNGLLDEMYAADCISIRQLQQFEVEPTDPKKNEELHRTLLRGSLATYKTFLRIMMDTKQHHVVSLLAPNLVQNVRPLSEVQQSRIKTNYSVLIRLLSGTRLELTGCLYAANCITKRQKEYIESATTETDCNKRLLNIINRGSDKDFEKFIECLNETNQHHVRYILLNDGGTVAITAAIDGCENIDSKTRIIIEGINELVSDTSNGPSVQKLDVIIRHSTELRKREIALAYAKEGSIVLFYFCKSLAALHCLHDWYVSEQLNEMMQEIFVALLDKRDVGDLHITTMQWDSPDYASCVRLLRDHEEILNKMHS